MVFAEHEWLLLHEVVIRGVVVPAGDVRAAMGVLVESGVVRETVRGLAPTPEGRARHGEWARLAPGSDAEAAVRRGYEAFLPLNAELVRVCADWQVRPGGTPNDHRDARYDWSVVERLRSVDERTGPVLRRLGRAVARFAGYRARLAHALAMVDEGDLDWMTSPRLDSYHTVWMQLHEDLRLALGLDRADEQPPR